LIDFQDDVWQYVSSKTGLYKDEKEQIARIRWALFQIRKSFGNLELNIQEVCEYYLGQERIFSDEEMTPLDMLILK